MFPMTESITRWWSWIMARTFQQERSISVSSEAPDSILHCQQPNDGRVNGQGNIEDCDSAYVKKLARDQDAEGTMMCAFEQRKNKLVKPTDALGEGHYQRVRLILDYIDVLPGEQNNELALTVLLYGQAKADAMVRMGNDKTIGVEVTMEAEDTAAEVVGIAVLSVRSTISSIVEEMLTTTMDSKTNTNTNTNTNANNSNSNNSKSITNTNTNTNNSTNSNNNNNNNNSMPPTMIVMLLMSTTISKDVTAKTRINQTNSAECWCNRIQLQVILCLIIVFLWSGHVRLRKLSHNEMTEHCLMA
eukprot:jgi/Psemu1/35254/gm1.35254_g